MSMKYRRLDLQGVQAIFVMRKRGKSIQEIARRTNRAKSTVHGVLNDYQHPDGIVWLYMTALERAWHAWGELKANRKRAGNQGCLRDSEKRIYVISRLVDDQWSPEQISEKMPEELTGKSIAAKTIYNFIKSEDPELKQYLQERGKPRRQRVAHRRGKFQQGAPIKTYIDERPAEINNRSEVGHWEGDTIVSIKGSTWSILTLIERVTRKREYIRIPNLQAKTALAYLKAFMKKYPPHICKSITFDNGSEFAYSEMIKLKEISPDLKIYYCFSYSAWQKGAVERANRDFRWYYPKGTDFAFANNQDIARIQQKINARPRKCLCFEPPEEVFYRLLKAA